MDCLLARGLCWAPSRYINQKRYMYADAGNIICRGEGRGGDLCAIRRRSIFFFFDKANGPKGTPARRVPAGRVARRPAALVRRR